MNKEIKNYRMSTAFKSVVLFAFLLLISLSAVKEVKAESSGANWREVYYDLISSTYGKAEHYVLFYLNDDDIPELYVALEEMRDGNMLYTYSSEKGLTSLLVGRHRDMKYHERENVLDLFVYGYKGTNLDQYYVIEDGGFKEIAAALHSNAYDELGGTYSWDSEPVMGDYEVISEETYYAKCNELCSPDDVMEILEYSDDGLYASSGGWLNYEEILNSL